MMKHKLWMWQITIVNGRIDGIDAKPIDYYTGDSDDAVVTSMYRRRRDYIVEVETVAATRADAERLALEVFERDVPDDMRGR